ALDEHLARAVDTVSDLVLSPNLPTKELEKEKDVVLEEMKMYEDNPEDLIFDKFESAVYADHELGRPIIGYPDTVSAFTREQLVDYMERRYTPNRIVLAVAGNARHEHVVRLARSAFAATRRTSPDVARIPVEGYESVQIVDYRPIQQAHLVIGARGMDVHNPDRAGLSVLNTILGGGMSSRLNQNIRERYGFCYNIYSFTNLHSDSGDLGVYMGTDANKIDRARKLIVRELEKLVEKPVSGRTLSQAKNQVRGSIMLGLESMSNRMMRLGRQELYFERFMSLDEINRDIEKVSPDDVKRIARDMFDKETFSSVVLLPQN
ncbi:MAG: pitrilysin family protein, partial [Rhodothermales bacterium]